MARRRQTGRHPSAPPALARCFRTRRRSSSAPSPRGCPGLEPARTPGRSRRKWRQKPRGPCGSASVAGPAHLQPLCPSSAKLTVPPQALNLCEHNSNNRMASLEELKDALRDTLAARGSLGQIQARVRAEIFSALEESVRIGVRVRGGGFARGV